VVLSPEHHSARMSEIQNVGYSRMALNTSKCNHLTPLRFKGLTPRKQRTSIILGRGHGLGLER